MNLGKIPPSILRSINAQPMQWKVALGEMGKLGLIQTTGRELVNEAGRKEREWRCV